MTDGSLKLMETARISLSYTETTSTFPWHQSVTAFCQWTILRGSYDAFRRSVCSMSLFLNFDRPPSRCQGTDAVTRMTPIGYDRCRSRAVRPIAWTVLSN